MANNLEQVIPQLLAQGVLALRSACVMPRLVNTDYDVEAKKKGATIDVPIPSAVAVRDVVPGPNLVAAGDSSPTTVPIPLDKWKEAPFYLTDKERRETLDGVIPMQASEAIKAIAEQINSDIMANYKAFFGFAGTPGTTPFASSTSDATATRRVLHKQLAPKTDRRFVLDPDAEANALDLRAFQDTSWTGDPNAIIEGELNKKLGFSWWMDQQVPEHTVGTNDGNYTTNAAGYAVGVKEVTTISGTGTILTGDVFTFAGDSQTYVATADMAAAGTLAFEPGLKVAIGASATAITVKGAAGTSYPQNLAFHRDAIAFASRPLSDEDGLGNIIESVVDPVTGLALRLEVARGNKQTQFSYDVLYGTGVVRRELGARLWG